MAESYILAPSKKREPNALDRGKDPWDMQSWESPDNFACFLWFRDDPHRSLKATIALFNRDALRNIASRDSWTERRKQYYAHNQKAVDTARADVRIVAAREMEERHAKIVKTLQTMCTIESARWLNKVAKTEPGKEPDLTANPELPLSEIRRILEFSMNFERLQHDLKTLPDATRPEVHIDADVVKKLLELDDDDKDKLADAMIVDV